jgi:hypothetical protein
VLGVATIMKNIRHIQLKVWPEIKSTFPAILPFERIDPNKKNPVDIDFTNLKVANSSSLVLLMVELVKVIREASNRKWVVNEPQLESLSKRLAALGAYEILRQFNKSLTLQWYENYPARSNEPIKCEQAEGTLHSFPLTHFKFENAKDKRALVEDFREYLFVSLQFLQTDYKFKIHKLIQILAEMAKNAADHTDSDAFFGMDITRMNDNFQIAFAFGDLGDGINNHVRSVISPGRAGHLALSEAYRFALTPGNSTSKNSKVNRGIGMTIILDMAKDIGVELSVFDAKSRGVLSNVKAVTHAELRKNFYYLGNSRDVGFYYYGEYQHIN